MKYFKRFSQIILLFFLCVPIFGLFIVNASDDEDRVVIYMTVHDCRAGTDTIKKIYISKNFTINDLKNTVRGFTIQKFFLSGNMINENDTLKELNLKNYDHIIGIINAKDGTDFSLPCWRSFGENTCRIMSKSAAYEANRLSSIRQVKQEMKCRLLRKILFIKQKCIDEENSPTYELTVPHIRYIRTDTPNTDPLPILW